MNVQGTEDAVLLTERERELGAIVTAYNAVTERLKDAHERLNEEVGRLRGELREKNAELQRRERLAALGEMAAGLAHEIRNPLGGIALYASMLEKELSDRPKAQTAAGKISQGVRSLERLVSEILDFAQEYCLEERVGRLGDILADVEESVRPWAMEQQCAVTYAASAGELMVYCDPFRLRQALVNLVMNGIQSAGAGGHLWVSAERVRRSGSDCGGTDGEGGVRIEVRDDGPGIAAGQMDRIFNPFFTTRATGTGLGLAIVHRIVECHGGTIRASNCREGGARFVLHLPRPAA